MSVLVACSALAGACSPRIRAPLTPVPLQIVSREPFVVHVPATADSLANACPQLRVIGKVAAVRGDTMFFSSVTSAARPSGAHDCLQGREGFLVLSSAPAARAELGEEHIGRTVLLTLFLGFVTAGYLLYLILSGT